MIYRSSEEQEYPASNLDFPSSDEGSSDNFWLSSPGQKYPQSLIIGLEDLFMLSQIQILSHETRITSRIDILTHDKSALECNSSVDDVKFKKLGHITLDQNERTSWQSREMKAVMVNVACRMIKLILHDPNPNKFNPTSQVGIVSVAVIGERVPYSPTRMVKQIEAESVDEGEDSGRQKREKILSKIELLEGEKREAVLVEDYDTAKAIKAKIDLMRTQIQDPKSKTDTKTNFFKSEDSPIRPPSKNGLSAILPNFGSLVEPTGEPPLPEPDPLPAYFARDYPQLLESLGEQRLSQLLSRDWRLRERGIVLVLSEASEKNVIDVYGVNWIVRKCLADKVVNVFIKVCDLIQKVLILGRNSSELLADLIEFAVIHMVEYRLIDGNKRVVDAVIVTLVKMAESENMPVQYLLKGRPTSKQVNARCLCLMSLIDSVGFKGKRGMSLDSLVHALGDWFASTPAAESKSWITQVLRLAATKAGINKVETALCSIEDFGLRENLLTELSRINGAVRSTTAATAIVCDFCGRSDPRFSNQDKMDLHYWQECPALIECQYCEQIVELTGLTEHRLKECDQGNTSDLFPLI